jgi:hypothetical protein
VEGGANTRNAIGMVERFTIEGACWGLTLKSSKFT